MSDPSAGRRTADSPPSSGGWELDKRIPAFALLGLLAYGVTGIWFIAGQAGQLLTQERRIVALEETNRDFQHTVSAINDKLGSMNEKAGRAEERSAYILERLQIPATVPFPASRPGLPVR